MSVHGVGVPLAYHGADVLNIWRPLDFEIDSIYFTSSVGMRSSTIEFASRDGMTKLKQLIQGTDVFFSNRRPGYLNHFHLTAEDLAEVRPGIIHVDMSLYGPTGPWSGRTGYDQNAGGVSGIFAREGTFENPSLTEIFVVNDYVMSWLSGMAVLSALKRRATKGGSYRIHISLARLSIWLLHMGIFAETPCGNYQGVTDQVQMSETPGFYKVPLVPRGSSQSAWLPRS
jgi:crotonobetainyl-CoA:carnitine CoA-transferase CaiB-like acyl-CoA transferase